jgi:hypothetical protein
MSKKNKTGGKTVKSNLLIVLDRGEEAGPTDCGECKKISFASNHASTYAKTCRLFEQTIGFGKLQRLPDCMEAEDRAKMLEKSLTTLQRIVEHYGTNRTEKGEPHPQEQALTEAENILNLLKG